MKRFAVLNLIQLVTTRKWPKGTTYIHVNLINQTKVFLRRKMCTFWFHFTKKKKKRNYFTEGTGELFCDCIRSMTMLFTWQLRKHFSTILMYLWTLKIDYVIIILHLLNNHNIIAKEIQSCTNQNEIKKSNREKGKRTVNDLNNIEFEPLLLVIAPSKRV